MSLFADDMIVYLENPIHSPKKLLDQINKFGKTVGYKVNIQKSMAFLFTNNELLHKETRGENPICYSNKKNKIPRNKLNQEYKRPVLGDLQSYRKTFLPVIPWTRV